MATVNGVNYTKILAGGPDNFLGRGASGGEVQVLTETYVAENLANGSLIAIPTLSAGDRIVGGFVCYGALGGSTTLTVGDSDDPDRYASVADSSGAGATYFNLVAGVDYVIGTNTGDDAVLVTLGGGNATGTLKVVLFVVKQ